MSSNRLYKLNKMDNRVDTIKNLLFTCTNGIVTFNHAVVDMHQVVKKVIEHDETLMNKLYNSDLKGY